MPDHRPLLLVGSLLILVTACAAPTPVNREAARPVRADSPEPRRGAGPVPLLINGEPVGWDVLTPLLAERAGPQVVDELVLESALRRELRARGLVVDDAAVEAERERWLGLLEQEGFSVTAETEIRRRRGLGPERFGRLLWRNAALRALLDPGETAVGENEVALAREIRHGRRYAATVVVMPDARTAVELVERARGDGRGPLAAVWTLAVERGVSPQHAVISPADPAYPDALRRAVASTPVGSPSGVVALDEGFGVVLVHAVFEPTGMVDEAGLRAELQTRKTRLAMERLAQRLVGDTTWHAMDRALSWGR